MDQVSRSVDQVSRAVDQVSRSVAQVVDQSQAIVARVDTQCEAMKGDFETMQCEVERLDLAISKKVCHD